jgi:ABC-type branched-subunit amino acid transport system substrate-binding protein
MLGPLGARVRRTGHATRLILGAGALVALAACSTFSFGPETTPTPGIAPISGQTLGTGPVRVALLLPLSSLSQAGLTEIGTSMRNAAELAVETLSARAGTNGTPIPFNITILIKDTQGDPSVARAQATQALSEGARLIIGPLRAESISAVAPVARSAGVPVIGFSSNSVAAAPGVYLMNVLPNNELRRSLSYAAIVGRRQAFAAIVPNNDYGRLQEAAFRQEAANLGLTVRAIYQYTNEQEATNAAAQLAPFIKDGSIDAVFLPDHNQAPSLANLLQQNGIDTTSIQIIGSANWDGVESVNVTPSLAGAIYPAVVAQPYNSILQPYQQRYGTQPNVLAPLAYTAIALANAQSLALSEPAYQQAALTTGVGFTLYGQRFFFNADGTSRFDLVIKQVQSGAAQQSGVAQIVGEPALITCGAIFAGQPECAGPISSAVQ